jgi:hypothetical protein
LDTFNLQVNIANPNERVLVYGSFQAGNTTTINNLSASIFRGSTIMSGITFVPLDGYINLAGNTGVDVQYPQTDTVAGYTSLTTSLWSISGLTSGGGDKLNSITCNMQAIDYGFTASGTYYYAIRVNTDSSLLNEKNIILYAINLG